MSTKPSVYIGGNSAFPAWDPPDEDEDACQEVADCDDCDGSGEVWLRDGARSCPECRGSGKRHDL